MPAIARLNARLAAGGVNHVVGAEASQQQAGPITERLFVAADGDEIRGAVWLKEHEFRIGGTNRRMGWPKYLVAESLIDSHFSAIPRVILRECLKEQPYLLGLGFGGHASPMARLLHIHKWHGETVPFLFRALRPNRVLLELEPLRRTRGRRAVATLLRVTALGGLALGGLSTMASLRAGRSRPLRNIAVDVVDRFAEWADDVWVRCADGFGFLTVRDSSMLTAMFPQTTPDLARLRVRCLGSDRGWAVVLRHDFKVGAPDRQFGRLAVGMIADVLSRPEDAPTVARAALTWLADAGADIVVSNQSHAVWIGALAEAGFVRGPVNFAFYRSPAVQQLLATQSLGLDGCHVTRGDGDGPVWYAG